MLSALSFGPKVYAQVHDYDSDEDQISRDPSQICVCGRSTGDITYAALGRIASITRSRESDRSNRDREDDPETESPVAVGIQTALDMMFVLGPYGEGGMEGYEEDSYVYEGQ